MSPTLSPGNLQNAARSEYMTGLKNLLNDCMKVVLPIPKQKAELNKQLIPVKSDIAEIGQLRYANPGTDITDAEKRLQDKAHNINFEIKKLDERLSHAISELKRMYKSDIDKRRDTATAKGLKDSTSTNNDAYKMLELPVVLKKSELQTLLDNNAYNPIFKRMVEQYVEKHNIPKPDYTTPIDRAEKRINDTLYAMELHITGRDSRHGVESELMKLAPEALANHPKLIESWNKQISDAFDSIEPITPTHSMAQAAHVEATAAAAIDVK